MYILYVLVYIRQAAPPPEQTPGNRVKNCREDSPSQNTKENIIQMYVYIYIYIYSTYIYSTYIYICTIYVCTICVSLRSLEYSCPGGGHKRTLDRSAKLFWANENCRCRCTACVSLH